MNIKIISVSSVLLLLFACNKDWDEHYNASSETVDKNMWEVIQGEAELSTFVQHIKDFELDTLFEKNKTYTLFIPNNAAFENYEMDNTVDVNTLLYLISSHFVQSGNISGLYKIQMFLEKYGLFERYNNSMLFDRVPLYKESPLYKNGKYYLMDQVVSPKPNLFEYYANTNPVFKSYIEGLDSIILDKELSRPIGFDDNGNTIYDTVAIIYNEFEDLFFPIREEFRNKTATVVFPLVDDYYNALDIMANTLGDVYQSHSDIPIDWQQDILIPYLLEHGVFYNSLTATDFIQTGLDTLKLKNILGDSINIEYQVKDRFDCSNGVAFNYQNFQIPDTLFNGSVRWEAEWFLEETGINRFAWYENIATETSDKAFTPYQELVPTASNDSIIRVLFDNNYAGNYTIEFKIDNLFPRKYLMVVRTKSTVGGIYDVYFNDEYTRTVDYYDYIKTPYYYWSVTGGRYFPEPAAYHYWDAWAINNNPYGEATVRLEYKGQNGVPISGLVIDYIDFIPYDD